MTNGKISVVWLIPVVEGWSATAVEMLIRSEEVSLDRDHKRRWEVILLQDQMMILRTTG